MSLADPSNTRYVKSGDAAADELGPARRPFAVVVSLLAAAVAAPAVAAAVYDNGCLRGATACTVDA
jgi:hypothetical protein